MLVGFAVVVVKVQVAELSESEADWPTFRADNQCTATSKAAVGGSVKQLWLYDPKMRMPGGAPHHIYAD